MSEGKSSQTKALALQSNSSVRHDVTVPTGMNWFSLANQAAQGHVCATAWRESTCLGSVLAPTASQKPSQEQSHSSQESQCSPLRPVLYCLWESTRSQTTNYADMKAFKNMLLIIQVPGRKPHTFTCGKNDMSFSWGPLPSSFLYFYFLDFLPFLRKRTDCLNIIKANYFSQNICLQA